MSLKGRLMIEQRGWLFSACLLAAALAGAVMALTLGGTCGCSEKAAQKIEAPSPDGQPVEPPSGGSGGPRPASSSERALEEAKKASRPVLLNFHSTRCIPCMEIEEQIKQVKPEYEDRVDFVIVDVYDPSEYDLCMKYNIRTIPTTVFLDASGQVVEGYVGVIDAPSLRGVLDRLLAE